MMTDLKELPDHLKTLTTAQWNALFAFIPEIESTEVFGNIGGGERLEDERFTSPYWIQAEIVEKTSNELFKLNILPVYDWTTWNEGRSLLNDDTDFKTLDVILLCKLLTIVYRLDRFSDGTIVHYFTSGVILKILQALKHNIEQKQ
jgi:hypothetical protein